MRPFNQVIAGIFSRTDLTGAQKLVLCALIDDADADGVARVTQSQLMQKTGLADHKIIRQSTRRLCDMGDITATTLPRAHRSGGAPGITYSVAPRHLGS